MPSSSSKCFLLLSENVLLFQNCPFFLFRSDPLYSRSAFLFLKKAQLFSRICFYFSQILASMTACEYENTVSVHLEWLKSHFFWKGEGGGGGRGGGLHSETHVGSGKWSGLSRSGAIQQVKIPELYRTPTAVRKLESVKLKILLPFQCA